MWLCHLPQLTLFCLFEVLPYPHFAILAQGMSCILSCFYIICFFVICFYVLLLMFFQFYHLNVFLLANTLVSKSRSVICKELPRKKNKKKKHSLLFPYDTLCLFRHFRLFRKRYFDRSLSILKCLFPPFAYFVSLV